MRLALPSLVFLCIGTTASAQFSVLPQIGLENSKTSFSANGSSYSSLGTSLAPRASVRLDYKFKQSHGPYIGFGTNAGVATITTTNPETILSNYTSSLGSVKWRFETGYGFSTKPISFQKNSAQKRTTASKTSSETKKSCGSYSSRSNTLARKNNTWNMRIQPSAGLALTQALNNDVITQTGSTGTTYNYKAGNWNTAITSGLGFEFAKGSSRKFAVGIQYLKGLGNLDERTISGVSEEKNVSSNVQSKASAWNLSFGIPFSLTKPKRVKQVMPAVQPQTQKTESNYKSKCGSYRRCTRSL